jgi:hypothetical protein
MFIRHIFISGLELSFYKASCGARLASGHTLFENQDFAHRKAFSRR